MQKDQPVPESVSIVPESVVDPRGVRKEPVRLAPRLADLKDRKVLLFDNSQLTAQVRTYGPLLNRIAAELKRVHGAACQFETRNLFDVPQAELPDLVDFVANTGAEAVVVALSKAGMTQPTSLFIVELERRGLPCVQICTEHSVRLATATAESHVPGLPVVVVDAATGDGETFGKREADAILPEIVAGLSTEAATLVNAFRARCTGRDVSAEDGKISLTARQATVNGDGDGGVIKVDPGAFAVEVYERFCDANMCDGLPVIPPTEDRVQAMLACTDLEPGHVLAAEIPPSGSSITVASLAVNSVMAGCRPEYFPILVTAFQAIADPAYRLFQGAITTHPSGNAVLVSGPLAEELGIHSGPGCLGPGFRANATIGRAVGMTITNVTRAIPGQSDMTVFGSPAEFTYCLAESDANNPWLPLHTDLYDESVTSVTVHKCEGPHNVVQPRPCDGPEALLGAVASVAATRGGNNMTHLGQLIVLLNPDHAEMIAAAGWSKQDVKEYLFELARHPQDATEGRLRGVFPRYFHSLEMVPVIRSAEDVMVVVAGARGGHSMVSIPWGLASAVTRPVSLKDGSPLQSLKGLFSRPR